MEFMKEGGKTVIRLEETERGRPLLEMLREQHIYVDAPCAGKGNCGRCRVRFLAGAPKPTEREKKLLTQEEQENGIRLACAVYPQEDSRIELPVQREEQIAALVKGKGTEIHTGQSKRIGYGVAIDIGTTTLAASLLHLKSGERVGVTSLVNHQRAYGADVISRIQAANDGAGDALRQSICSDIDSMLKTLVFDAGVPVEAVEEIVIVGNTTMCHLLRGLSCVGLGISPFTPEDISLWEGRTADFPSLTEWDAKVTILPGISAFVGADIVAGIYGSGMEDEEACLFLDIGTNGEMAVGGREGLLVTSAAAGPVFEGGGITCGVPGVPGAVTEVCLERLCDNGTMDTIRTADCRTIAGKGPIGLCGTGIIAVMGELVRLGLVDENGTLAEPWFSENVPVAGADIYFSEQDIRQVQMGKAAIRAGIETLLLEYGDRPIQKIYIAGGFGCYLDVTQAIRIGMFPESFEDHVEMLGNSALAGAEKFLTEDVKTAVAQIERIVLHAREIGLARHPRFNELYLESMFF